MKLLSNKFESSSVKFVLEDYETAIKKLSLPLITGTFLITLYNLVDSIWVAGLGVDVLIAVGFITPLFIIILGVGSGIGAGTNSLISYYIGAKNYDQANNTALHGIYLTTIISIVGTIFMYFTLPSILLWMGADADLELSLKYGYIIFLCMFIFLFNFVYISILRAEGDVKRSMYATTITALLNMILDPIMIYILDFGIEGAAYTTVISALTSCIILVYWVHYKKDIYLDVSFKNFRYDRGIIRRILNVTLPTTIENLTSSFLVILINILLINTADITTIGVYIASARIVQLANILFQGLVMLF